MEMTFAEMDEVGRDGMEWAVRLMAVIAERPIDGQSALALTAGMATMLGSLCAGYVKADMGYAEDNAEGSRPEDFLRAIVLLVAAAFEDNPLAVELHVECRETVQ